MQVTSAYVTSIEADPELEPVLDAHAADYANFRFIMGDALKVGPEQIEQAAGILFEDLAQMLKHL